MNPAPGEALPWVECALCGCQSSALCTNNADFSIIRSFDVIETGRWYAIFYS